MIHSILLYTNTKNRCITFQLAHDGSDRTEWWDLHFSVGLSVGLLGECKVSLLWLSSESYQGLSAKHTYTLKLQKQHTTTHSAIKILLKCTCCILVMIIQVVCCDPLPTGGRGGDTSLLEVKERGWFGRGSHEHVRLVLVGYVDL